MTRSLLRSIALAACWPIAVFAGAPTSIERGGVVYGARDDERGPIGGGSGYASIVVAGDATVRDLDELIAALAAAKTGDVVFIPGDAEIDLKARIYVDELVLDVPGGVTLASDRGRGDSAGALLTSDALETPVMIRAVGPDVRITGLRLRGPNAKRYLEHHARALALYGDDYRDYYYKFPTSNGIVTAFAGLEVDNCEVWGFAHAGVDLRQGDGHEVHHCSIHHCQYQGLGYGVCHNQAFSTIECNLFDSNRHSIAGTGRPPSGYVARNNVELGTSLSHCFDMHGGRDRRDGTNTAGARIEVVNNTFRAPQLPVKIRGVPEESCEVHGNWFVEHDDAAAAVQAAAGTRVFDNAYKAEGAVRP